MAEERTKYAVAVPKLGSLILTHEWDGEVRGLKEWPAAERPNATVVFWSFRVMVAIGMAMFVMGLWSLVLRARRKLYDSPMFLRWVFISSPGGLIAVIAGWITTEVGRQPWTIYGLLTTAESASSVAAEAVAASLAAFAVVYFAVFGAGAFYMLRLMGAPPHPSEPDLPPGEPMRAHGIMPAPVMEQADAAGHAAATPRAGTGGGLPPPPGGRRS
jgi:cytochrome d ubiquinol oxidase subunit I